MGNSCAGHAKQTDDDQDSLAPAFSTIVPKVQVVRLDADAVIGDEYLMCTLPKQASPPAFGVTSAALTPQLLQLDVGAPCSIFLVPELGNVIITRQGALSGVKVVRNLDTTPVDTGVENSPTTSSNEADHNKKGGGGRKTSIATRKTSVVGLLQTPLVDDESLT